MISAVLSRLVILLFGTLYPAYASYKAVRTRNVKEYIKWMMYWIVFALFTCAETFTDIFFSFWFPFYYEIKIILVIYLLSPATKGSSILYRKFVHPALSKREQEIDEYIAKAKQQGYHAVLNLGSKGVNYATTILMQTAIKGGGGLIHQIRKSYSLSDLSSDKDNKRIRNDSQEDEVDEMSYSTGDPRLVKRNQVGYITRRSSSGSQVDMYFPEVDVRQRNNVTIDEDVPLGHIRSTEDISSGYSSSDPLYAGAKSDSREPLVRTSSVGGRVRTRAASKTVPGRKTAGVAEDSRADDVDDIDGSDTESHLGHPLIPNPSGNFVNPCVTQPYQNMLANVTPEQLYALLYYNFNNNQSESSTIDVTNDWTTDLTNKDKVTPEEIVNSSADTETKVENPNLTPAQETAGAVNNCAPASIDRETVTVATEISTPATEILTPITKRCTSVSEVLTPSAEISTPVTEFLTPASEISTPATEVSTPATETSTPVSQSLPSAAEIYTPVTEILTPAHDLPAPVVENVAVHAPEETTTPDVNQQSSTNKEENLNLLKENKSETTNPRSSPCRMLRDMLEAETSEMKKQGEDTQSIRSGRYRKKQAPAPPTVQGAGSLTDLNRLSKTSSYESVSSKSTEFDDSDDFLHTFVTPSSSPILTPDTDEHKTIVAEPPTKQTKDSKTKQKGAVSKILHMPKIPFNFWSKPKDKEDFSKNLTRNDSFVSIRSVDEPDSVYIPLKDETDSKKTIILD